MPYGYDDACRNCGNKNLLPSDFPCCDCGENDGKYWLTNKGDPVHHPSHYCQEDSMECIDEMIAVFGERVVAHFCLCNVWKYRKRALFKNGEEDIKKSDWYMSKYKEIIDKIGMDNDLPFR